MVSIYRWVELIDYAAIQTQVGHETKGQKKHSCNFKTLLYVAEVEHYSQMACDVFKYTIEQCTLPGKKTVNYDSTHMLQIMTKHFTLITADEGMYECCLTLLHFFIFVLFGGRKVSFHKRR